MNWRFDVIVIGAGQVGPPLAGRLTAAGMSVAVIERELFGVRHLDQHGWLSSGTTMARIGRGRRPEGSGGRRCPMRSRGCAGCVKLDRLGRSLSPLVGLVAALQGQVCGPEGADGCVRVHRYDKAMVPLLLPARVHPRRHGLHNRWAGSFCLA
jgi:hypothetical protein